MTQKEKARRYDEALEIAKKNYMSAQDLCKDSKIGILNVFKNTLERIFPELKESEDEEIRKEIDDYNQWIAWLEKQGEQKSKNESTDTCGSLIIKSKEFPASKKRDFGYFSESVDKIEPKFHVRDWVVTDKGDTIQIAAVNSGYYTLNNGIDFNMSYVDKYWRLWTIQDAKEGDVLASDNGIIILVKESRDSSWGYRLSYHCAILYDGTFEYREFHVTPEVFFPATEEQRDLLFSKIRKADCEWDDDKKELKKIEPNDTTQEERKY